MATTYILAINCGSSSIKTKLYSVSATKGQPLTAVAEASVKGIAAKGQKIKIKVEWLDGKGNNVSEEGEEGDKVDCRTSAPISIARAALTSVLASDQTLPPLLLEKIKSSHEGIEDDQIKYISHRM
jgi:acetate kinase